MPISAAKQPVVLRAARLLTPHEEIRPGSVLIREGRIAEAGCEVDAAGARVVDLSGLTVAPGFIDVHVHGGGGFSLATSDPEEITAYSAWAPAHGVTSFLAGIVARTAADAEALMRATLAAETGGAELLGFNLEGPFVNPARRGALPPSWPVAPDGKTFDQLLGAAAGRLRLMTVAPETSGALDIIMKAAAAGVRISIGHTDATYDQVLAGFEAGASHVTHAFNAMRPFHHRDPGPVGAALDVPGVTVEVIADGVHLHPATVRMLRRSFGPDRIALITDAVQPAGLPAGVFRLGGQEARSEAGRVTLPDGTIAGSASTMDEVVRNAFRWGGATLDEAVLMASTVPSAVAGVAERKGRIETGYDADLVALSEDLTIAATWCSGRPVYAAAGVEA